MKHVLALLLFTSLACGGAVESAKQAAAGRAEREIAERALEYGLGAQDVQIGTDGSAVIRTADGELRTGVGAELPPGFPLTLPPQVVLSSSMDLSSAEQKLWSFQGVIQGDLAAAKAAMAALDAQMTSNGWASTMNSDMDAGTGMLSMRAAEKGPESVTVSIAGDGNEYVVVLSWIVKNTP